MQGGTLDHIQNLDFGLKERLEGRFCVSKIEVISYNELNQVVKTQSGLSSGGGYKNNQKPIF